MSNEAILDAVKNGKMMVRGGAVRYVGSRAVVVLNGEGQVVTAWPKGYGGIRSPSSGAALGVIMTIVCGADALFQGAHAVIKYRRRLNDHIRAIDDDNDNAYGDEGTTR